MYYCVQGPCENIAPERQGLKSGSHSRDGTTTILRSKLSKMGCTMLGDEYISRVYNNELFACTTNATGTTGIIIKGGPEPLEKESNEFLGSKRDDRFSNPFLEIVPKTCRGSFFVPSLS